MACRFSRSLILQDVVSELSLFSEINLASDKLGKTYAERNAQLCKIIKEIAEGLSQFSVFVRQRRLDALQEARVLGQDSGDQR